MRLFKQEKSLKKDSATLHGISKRYDDIIVSITNFIKKYIKLRMLHIILIWLEKMLPFQTKRKMVVILCLFCISVQRQHIFLKKLIRKKPDQVRPKNIVFKSRQYYYMLQIEYLQRNLKHFKFWWCFAIRPTENMLKPP